MATTISELLKNAVDNGASDLHLAANLPPALRIDGQLRVIEKAEPVSAKIIETLAWSMISTEAKERFIKDRELDFAYSVDGIGRFRVNLHWEKGAIGLVARAIPSVLPTMEDLGMPEIIYQLARMDQGLVLMTGPTGHGKSTSMAAMVNLINEEKTANIVTFEDPIEFIFSPKKSIIKQRELGTDMLSFAEGLKHVLRQDPNVVMVGEMRDLETISTAITVAETGHLVLATLHTYNAAQTIDRIIDVFPPYQQDQVRLQVSMTLKGVISQRLLPRKEGGRVAVREVLVNTPAISTLIRDGKTNQIPNTIQTGVAEGMRPLDQDLKDLYSKGIIDEEVAKRYITNVKSLKA